MRHCTENFHFSLPTKKATQVVRLGPSRNTEESFAEAATGPIGTARKGPGTGFDWVHTLSQESFCVLPALLSECGG